MGFEIWSGNGNIIYQNTINTNHSENGIILRYANPNIISWNIIKHLWRLRGYRTCLEMFGFKHLSKI